LVDEPHRPACPASAIYGASCLDSALPEKSPPRNDERAQSKESNKQSDQPSAAHHPVIRLKTTFASQDGGVPRMPQALGVSVGPVFGDVPRRTETERDRGPSFPVRGSAGRLYSLNRADRFHDREPVPVQPEVADLPLLHLVPRTGGRLPPFASWSDPSKVALVRRGGAHPNGDQLALGNHLLHV